ncbi:unnamed protein product [Brassicogethes aeneus]|uniref:Octanoyl-[acyl-carrier-protein]:protein N-octanoyltransferase LIPT2, mitochondrial n=1 Tax=Brassicogethes aeneus TaxID=1431903 RepID=A0A9P0FG94_BRAAE|nr:unnamed protein product [Brassicogethes aeneus]
MERLIKVWHVGKIDYAKALKLQKYLAKLHNGNTHVNNTLLCLEHPPVFTTGIRTKQYTLEEENRLKNTGADFFRTDRGGLITFHGPGQLIAYPILNLKHFKPSVRWYVCHIEKTIIKVCKAFGLNAETSPHTGVWINDNKVCAIGIHGSRFVTTHGLALNCTTNLKWFKHIVPCGIEGKGVTSLSHELNKDVSINDVLPTFLDCFAKTFDARFIDFPKNEAEEILNKIDSE